MIKNVRYLSLCFSLLFLVSCAKQEVIQEPVKPPKPQWSAASCQQTDWYLKGREEGIDGQISTDIQKIAALCADLGVQIDTHAYFRGVAERAQAYCTPWQGRHLGQQGSAYPSLCRPEIYSEFYYEWNKNLQQYCHTQRLNAEMSQVCVKAEEPASGTSEN